jgi:hypothetical protein
MSMTDNIFTAIFHIWRLSPLKFKSYWEEGRAATGRHRYEDTVRLLKVRVYSCR